MIRHAIFSLTMLLLLSGCKENADPFDSMGYEAQYMLCFKSDALNIRKARVSFINPYSGSIRGSGEWYGPDIKRVGTRLVYQSSDLVHDGRRFFVGLESTKDQFLVWEFPVSRYFKDTDWSDWKAPVFGMSGELVEHALLIDRATKLPVPKGTDIWFRYRIVKYNRSPAPGEIPLCPGDAG